MNCEHLKLFVQLLLGLSEGNARVINSAALLFFLFFFAFSRLQRLRRMNPREHGLEAMAAFVENSSRDESERNSMAIGAFWERVGPRTLQKINLRAILYE